MRKIALDCTYIFGFGTGMVGYSRYPLALDIPALDIDRAYCNGWRTARHRQRKRKVDSVAKRRRSVGG